MSNDNPYRVTQVPISQGVSKTNRVYSAGEGEPLVFLHGPFGQEWPSILTSLAKQYRVIAPEIPGADDPRDLTALLSHWDLLVYYDELFDNLGLETFTLVGHSFGGMIAAEYAAIFRNRVRKLVLIDPMGLWLDEYPVADFVSGDIEELRQLMWADGAPSEADRFRPRTDIDPDDATEELLRNFLSIAAAANFAHPIPDRGLKTRLHRISAPTQLLWGERDGFVDPAYGAGFHDKIPDARLKILAGAAHHPHIEREAESFELLSAFFAD
ncbi:alpha/beta hydrolase [Sphingopyxis sp. CCNWLW253]|uniref:alpha/beta fold hydrolase n=1 Tax=unclassified Sphingopyxis TaxID=2614943 RepID=UPI0030129E83